MEQALVKAAQLILSLSILVVLHEFGHYMFARLFKTRVEKFYLFFDPWFSLFKVKKGDTEYGIGWVPLGGYVKISGMIDESMDKEAMKLPPQPWEFRSKPAWQRLLIMVGGVTMNFLFAIIVYAGVLYVWGEQYLPNDNVKYGVVVGDTGEQLGFRNGDKILSIDNNRIEDFSKIVPTIVLDHASSVQVERDGQKMDIPITTEDFALLLKSKGVFAPRYPFEFVIGGFAKESPGEKAGLLADDKIVSVDGQEFVWWDEFQSYLDGKKGQSIVVGVLRNGQPTDFTVQLGQEGIIGIANKQQFTDVFELKTIRYGLFASIPAGISKGVQTTKDYLKQFKLFLMPETKAYESLGGFITIGSIFPGTWNWEAFWLMTAFISIILAIMNLLPIPALDGGHVMFLFFEMISGRKPGEKFMEYAQIAGMVILLGLVLFANANDVIKLFK
ncbi:MAG TPA: RIP metalloprotease RseP [Prolixibacteraceae bacterium]|nr:RIP metalloprotease RseP [Prolixibacteraceae bacterium]